MIMIQGHVKHVMRWTYLSEPRRMRHPGQMWWPASLVRGFLKASSETAGERPKKHQQIMASVVV